jgi:hypothetical protein
MARHSAIVVSAATASRYRLRTISGLARAAPGLVFGGPPECPERPDCLPGLRRTYGAGFRESASLDTGWPLTRQALEAGDIGAALLFTSGGSVFWLDSDQAGPGAVTVTLTAACDTSGAVRIPSDQAGARRFERPLSLQPRLTLTRMYTFGGGCVTYQFSFVPGAASPLAIPVDTAVAFEPRADLVRHIRRTEGLALCGRGAACPR